MVGKILGSYLRNLIHDKKWDEIRTLLLLQHPADIADLIVDIPDEHDAAVFRLLPRELASQVFSYLPPNHQSGLIHTLSHDQMRNVLAGITPDDQARLLQELPAEVTRRIVEALPPDELSAARELLGYPPGSAGRFMTPRYVALRPDMTAREALLQVRAKGKGMETLNTLYIVDDKGKLVEDVRLGSLVVAEEEAKVMDLALAEGPHASVKAAATRDEVISTFQKYDRSALPVTDSEGSMLGIITADDVLDAAQKRATDEIQKLGGSEALDQAYFDVGFWPMVKKRGGWLAALFLGETLTATAMGKYEHAIAQASVLALFVPLIISSGGNSGSQATSILIRSLALQEVKLGDWWRVFRKEFISSLALGVFLGAIGMFRIGLWYWLGWQQYEGHPYLMGLTVWGSLIGVVMFGSIVGSMLPFLLRKLGFDPATASAPFVATLVDVTGLVIYFTVASFMLRGTLL